MSGRLLLGGSEPGPPAKAALPALTQLLQDENADVQSSALGLLAGIDPKLKVLTATLLALLKNKAPVVRYSAVLAVGRMGPEAKFAVPVLTGVAGRHRWRRATGRCCNLGEHGA